jgi:beta-xylosidase
LLQIVELNADGSARGGKRKIVFDGSENHPVIEGPKFLKRNGFYYILAPAGGVATGWQTVLRSKNIWGPYEDKIVLAQGNTEINGPHQGGLVELANGESWFLHFQERQPYGRIVHMQPVQWIDDWPVMGHDPDGDGKGEPVLHHKKPKLGDQPVRNPVVGDEFDGEALSLAWQWQAQPQKEWYSRHDGRLRLRAVYPIEQPFRNPSAHRNLWTVPQLLLQKLPAPAFTAETRLDASALRPGERGGLILMGQSYAALVVERDSQGGGLSLKYLHCANAQSGSDEQVIQSVSLPAGVDKIRLRLQLETGGLTAFSWAKENGPFTAFDKPFQAVPGLWIGAKVGLFVEKEQITGEKGWIDFEYFQIE